MDSGAKQSAWTDFLKFFNKQNAGRPTRIGVFELVKDVVQDYWIEDGLPLIGVDLDFHGESPSVQLMVGQLTHGIQNAVKISCHLTANGDQDGLDIHDREGRMTILRFEDARFAARRTTAAIPVP